MKKIYSTLILIAALGMSAQAQTVWDNFEDVRKGTYGFINGVFIPYTLNPDQSGENTSQVVATYIRNSVEQFDVLITEAPMANTVDYLTGVKEMSIDVWSPAAGVTVQITLEDASISEGAPFPTGRHSIYLTQTTVAGQWETLTFSFSEQPDPTVFDTNVDRLVLLFSPNTTTGDTYYFDNLVGPEFAEDVCADVATTEGVLNDFECQQNINFIAASSPAALRRIANPDQTGNSSDYVGTYVRSGQSDDNYIAATDGPLELNDNTTQITMDVWDPNAPTTVILSLQNSSNELIQELVAQTSVSESWETLSFDIAPEVTQSPDIERLVFLFDFGSATGDTYFFDNIQIPGLLTSSEDTEYVSDLKAFPNPANDFVTIAYNLEKQGDVNITLTDITGRVVENKVFDNQPNGSFRMEFNTSNYAAGIYLYNVNISGQNHTGKIIVNN